VQWQWRAKVDWSEGEIFGIRSTSRAGHGADLEDADAAQVEVMQGHIRVAGVGGARVAGTWDRHKGMLADADLRTDKLGLGPVYETLLKPFLQQTAAADLRAEGAVTLTLEVRDRTIHAVTVDLSQVSIEDRPASVVWSGRTRAVAPDGARWHRCLAGWRGAAASSGVSLQIAMRGEQFGGATRNSLLGGAPP
jgi:hypothetical protein